MVGTSKSIFFSFFLIHCLGDEDLRTPEKVARASPVRVPQMSGMDSIVATTRAAFLQTAMGMLFKEEEVAVVCPSAFSLLLPLMESSNNRESVAGSTRYEPFESIFSSL